MGARAVACEAHLRAQWLEYCDKMRSGGWNMLQAIIPAISGGGWFL